MIVAFAVFWIQLANKRLVVGNFLWEQVAFWWNDSDFCALGSDTGQYHYLL